MAESAEQVHARASRAAGPDGRLPVPAVTGWETFPWEAARGKLAVRRLAPPEAEGPREGEGDRPCPVCAEVAPPWEVIWENDRWRVKHGEQSGLPMVLLLETKAHLDYPDLDDGLAAELGRISVWLARIMERLPHVGRTQVLRWGDGCSHVHLWFLARTDGLPSVRGSFAAMWDEILPPGPEDVWRADLATVARKLATHDGHALV